MAFWPHYTSSCCYYSIRIKCRKIGTVVATFLTEPGGKSWTAKQEKCTISMLSCLHTDAKRFAEQNDKGKVFKD
jgi:hypothetical protein